MLGLKDHAGHRRQPVFIVAAISLLSLGAAACSSSGSSSSSSSAASSSAGPTGTPTGTLTITTDEPPQTFDPIQSTNSTVDQMNLNDYNTLVQYPDGQTTTLEPQLATSWQVSAN